MQLLNSHTVLAGDAATHFDGEGENVAAELRRLLYIAGLAAVE